MHNDCCQNDEWHFGLILGNLGLILGNFLYTIQQSILRGLTKTNKSSVIQFRFLSSFLILDNLPSLPMVAISYICVYWCVLLPCQDTGSLICLFLNTVKVDCRDLLYLLVSQCSQRRLQSTIIFASYSIQSKQKAESYYYQLQYRSRLSPSVCLFRHSIYPSLHRTPGELLCYGNIFVQVWLDSLTIFCLIMILCLIIVSVDCFSNL